jgi:hypothetical protein
MSAGCYLCELKYGTIPEQHAGDAVGACKLCGILACRGHAYRNGGKPAYICGICIPNLLTVAAIRKMPKDGEPPFDIPSTDSRDGGPNAPPDFGAWPGDVNYVEDVIDDFDTDRWKSIRSDAAYLVSLLTRPGPTIFQPFSKSGAAQARVLLATAIGLATHFHLPTHEMIPLLREATQAAQMAQRYV